MTAAQSYEDSKQEMYDHPDTNVPPIAVISQRIVDHDRRLDKIEIRLDKADDTMAMVRTLPVQISGLETSIREIKQSLIDIVKSQNEGDKWRENFRLQQKNYEETRGNNQRSGFYSIIGFALMLFGLMVGAVIQIFLKLSGK